MIKSLVIIGSIILTWIILVSFATKSYEKRYKIKKKSKLPLEKDYYNAVAISTILLSLCINFIFWGIIL
jgi:hypothetical protein